MRRLFQSVHRLSLMLLALTPVCALLFELFFDSRVFGLAWFACQSLIASATSFVPAVVGNYTERSVIVYEGGVTGDPNPDRESRHDVIKEGRRFFLRLTIDIVLIVINIAVILLLPSQTFINGDIIRRLGFALVSTFILMLTMRGASAYDCFWTDTPGVLVGFVFYLFTAVFLKVSPRPGGFNAFIIICAILYLFMGAIALNSRSVAASMSSYADKLRRPPKPIGKRNRRIVIAFASLVTLAALIGAVRQGIMWLLSRVGDFLKLVSRLFGGGNSADAPNMPAEYMRATVTEAAPQIQETAPSPSVFSDIIAYVFLGIVVIGFLYLLFSLIKKVADKLSKLLENFAKGVNEGYYDEREKLMTAEEAGDRLKSRLRDRLKALTRRETPWEKLSGRERARRLFKLFRKKRSKDIKGVKSLTAREFISAADCHRADKNDFANAYDAARYSQSDIDASMVDKIKKDLNV